MFFFIQVSLWRKACAVLRGRKEVGIHFFRNNYFVRKHWLDFFFFLPPNLSSLSARLS